MIHCRFAACLWLYSTFDNVDGKQARRTGTSSPLGELFDHGCDALNCTLGGLVHCAAMGLGTGGWSCVVLFLSLWGFYLPTWEEYHTGILHLGYINGPTEGILIVCGIMILSGIFGNYNPIFVEFQVRASGCLPLPPSFPITFHRMAGWGDPWWVMWPVPFSSPAFALFTPPEAFGMSIGRVGQGAAASPLPSSISPR